ncbi:phage tail tape measure protein [Allosphingosinicella deserti]|uniref:Phage tail tape measure protein n=1 Tax=Allosphingosinicella deserti TaxID=2116704 RepID=A0A2P7QW29_9SPHN|nr:phage tail tape measure protein [Sphingomonas deserti]PSJ42149.1 phage tail tape measure protein [Sphingomonas deserti]
MATSLIGSLAVNLSLETAAFRNGATEAQRQMAGLQKKLSSVGANLAKAGAGLSLAVSAPLLAFGKGAVTAASDAAELQSAFDQTFGEMAGEMNKWAEATGNALGRSTREMQEGAKTFGLYFNQMGKTRAEAAKMSQTFTVLAQDLASFHNTSGEDALAALQSGLSGESEPLRKFGVFLSEAAVNAKAAELGIGSLGGTLTEQEKIQARYALILEATKNAQGDVARTSGSTANQVKASQAAWEELQITIGTKLLPALTPLITAFTGILIKFNELSPATQTFIVGAGAIAAALGPVLLALSPVVTAFSALLPVVLKLGPIVSSLIPLILSMGKALMVLALNPVGAVITALAVAVGAVYLAWKNWDTIKPIIVGLYTTVKTWILDKLNAVWESVMSKIRTVANAFKWLDDVVVRNSYIPDMVTSIGDHMARLDDNMVGQAETATKKTAEAFAGMAQNIASSLQGIVGSIKRGDWLGAIEGVAGAVGQFGGFGGSKVPAMANVTGMANGGAFSIAGRGGIDRNLLSVNGSPVARVSRGERVSVSPNGGGSGRMVNFDLRGAVMTQDLLAQMNQIGDVSSLRGAAIGYELSQTTNHRKQRQRL